MSMLKPRKNRPVDPKLEKLKRSVVPKIRINVDTPVRTHNTFKDICNRRRKTMAAIILEFIQLTVKNEKKHP